MTALSDASSSPTGAQVAAGINTSTVAGGKIKQALLDYGAYIVDDTGGGNSAAICMEAQVNDEMRENYGYAMTYPHGVSAAVTDPGRALYADLLQLFRGLHAVSNNGPGAVGGGGAPRVATKPPICGAPPTPPTPPPTTPPPAGPLCEIRVSGFCPQYPDMPGRGWFDDARFGGPPATAAAACAGRADSWKVSCANKDVAFKFTPKSRIG